MACQKATLDLKRKDVVLVKPSKSTPSCILSLSTLDNKVSNNNICQTVHVYRSSTIFDNSNSNFNPSHDFKEALSKALIYYNPFAGTLFFLKNYMFYEFWFVSWHCYKFISILMTYIWNVRLQRKYLRDENVLNL
jgi:hypothetical protein